MHIVRTEWGMWYLDRDFSYCSQSLVRWSPYSWIMEDQYCGPGINEICWRLQCAGGPVSYLECHSLSTWQCKRWQTMLQVEAHIFVVYWEVDSFCNCNEPYIVFLPPLIFGTFTLLTKLSGKLLFLIQSSIMSIRINTSVYLSYTSLMSL